MCLENYIKCDDKDLILCYRNGEKEAASVIITRYVSLINKRLRNVKTFGFESDDIKQEAYMGLLSAIRSYNTDSDTDFVVYASVCISNSIKNFLKSNYTIKSKTNIFALNLDDDSIKNHLSDDSFNPENIYIVNERFDVLMHSINSKLSSLEREVVFNYLRGLDYSEISKILNIDSKAVDNALCRARRKLKVVLTVI